MVKRITLKCGAYRRKYFVKYIAENGNAVCTINDEIVEPSAGNEIFRELKARGAEVVSRDILEYNDRETIDFIDEGIDEFVEYIENFRQYEEARAHNDRLRKIMNEFTRVAGTNL